MSGDQHPHDHEHPHRPLTTAALAVAERLRRVCLALPESAEKETWGTPTYRVRDKIFAMQGGEGRAVELQCKAPAGAQEVLVGADPERFFVPAYVGHNGWVGVRLGPGADWGVVASLVLDSYRMTAPKRIAAQLDGVAPAAPARRRAAAR